MTNSSTYYTMSRKEEDLENTMEKTGLTTRQVYNLIEKMYRKSESLFIPLHEKTVSLLKKATFSHNSIISGMIGERDENGRKYVGMEINLRLGKILLFTKVGHDKTLNRNVYETKPTLTSRGTTKNVLKDYLLLIGQKNYVENLILNGKA